MAILGPYTYTPYLWLHLGTVICLVVLCVYAWLHRRVPGALPFAIGSLLGAVWVLASLMEYAAVDVTTKIFWVKVQGVLQLPTVTLIACFVLEYAAPGRWLNRRNLILLAIAPLLFLLLALTNDFHHLAWRGFVYDGAVMTLRENRRRKHDTLNDNWFETIVGAGEEVLPEPLDREQWGDVRERYYELRGWNPSSGRPTRPKLEQLGMGDVADTLENAGRLG